MIFTDPETAVREHPDLVREYFGTVIPYLDNKFAALNSAVWSGGSFVYVPPGVKVEIPLQAYFRINARSFGQFERTLIIADEGSFVHYIEGCTAPDLHHRLACTARWWRSSPRRARGCATPPSRTGRNDVYNLVTKRAVAHEDATVEWVDGNIGSKRTMKYPSVYLMGEGAHGEVLSDRLRRRRARSRTPAARPCTRPATPPRSSPPSPSARAGAWPATAGC